MTPQDKIDEMMARGAAWDDLRDALREAIEWGLSQTEASKALEWIATFTVGKVHGVATSVCCGQTLEQALEQWKDAPLVGGISTGGADR